MPRYLLSTPAYINERYHQAGEVVETDLVPGPHMEPALDEKGREDKDARAAKDRAKQDARSVPGDPKFIGDLVKHNMEDGSTNGRIESLSGPAPTSLKPD